MAHNTILLFCFFAVLEQNYALIKQQYPKLGIVGGKATNIKNLPYQAALTTFGVHKCGASIVGPKIIITAAHCTEGSYLKELAVRVGTSIRGDESGVSVSVDRYFNHPKYQKLPVNHDLAVVFLKSSLNFTDEIQPISLPSLYEPIPVGDIGIVSGWGRLSETGSPPKILQSLEVPVLNSKDCAKSYELKFGDDILCAGYMDGKKDACKQDSGGPLVVNNKLRGVVSWAIGCARPKYPGLYANVANMMDWVDEIIKTNI